MDEELVSVNPTLGLMKHLQIARNKVEHVDPLNHEEVAVPGSLLEIHSNDGGYLRNPDTQQQ